MDYFSLSKVKQNVFKQKKRQKEEVGLKSSSFSCFFQFFFFRYFDGPLGGAAPALTGDCVRPVPSWSRGAWGGVSEKSTVSRPQRTSARGSVKTSALEGWRETGVLPAEGRFQ